MLRISTLHLTLFLAVVCAGMAVGKFAIPPRAEVRIVPLEARSVAITPARVVSEPDMPVVVTRSLSNDFATARRDRNGSYVFDAEINGRSLRMMFDTGASFTVLRAEDAGRLGIDTDRLTYSAIVSTANGRTAAAPVTIETLTIGDITRHRIPALVSRPGDLGVNLLGQSFMSKIGGYRVVGQELILQSEP